MENNDYDFPEVKRGDIYEYLNTVGERLPGYYVLVLSGEGREQDSFVSVLFLVDEQWKGGDAVGIWFKGSTRYVNCRMVTYCARRRLGVLAGMCDPVTMMRIDGKIPALLGLKPMERQDYEKLYNDTMTLIGKKGDVSQDMTGEPLWHYSYLRKEGE